MRKSHIQRLIENGEHQQQDFKFEINDARKIARSLVAFANTDGGRLLIGVKDNGVIAGVRSEEELHMIEAAAHIYSRPRIKYSANTWNVDGKIVVEVVVEPGKQRPYSASNEDGKYKVYLRKHDSNILANRLLVRAWRLRHSSKGVFMTLDREQQVLMDILKDSEGITLSRFCKVAQITQKHAEKIIVNLMALDIIDYKEEDLKTVYILK
ncbi:MAG: putative DNA binding domain-containing protein [Salinivirgaceae bacterium]|nr:putative DNA binding domain-containing protein [Salinivirgaceae bacterium]